jgi:RNA polymerase sigma-70 factor (ECF subfamily)
VDNPEQVYRQYRSELLAFIQQRVGTREVAQDILHDVFVKILGRTDCLREPAKITAWLYQVTRNAIIDRFRSNRLHQELPQEIPFNNEESTAGAKLASVLRPMIETLPKIYRDAVILSDLEGVRLKQIAEREGITLSAVKSRVQRGRRLLEAALRDCCAFEFSSRGEIMDFWPKSASGCPCHNSPDGLRSLSGTTAKESRQQPGLAEH